MLAAVEDDMMDAASSLVATAAFWDAWLLDMLLIEVFDWWKDRG